MVLVICRRLWQPGVFLDSLVLKRNVRVRLILLPASNAVPSSYCIMVVATTILKVKLVKGHAPMAVSTHL